VDAGHDFIDITADTEKIAKKNNKNLCAFLPLAVNQFE
jgi:hypothetical protein